jgi:hypothetical protein
LAEFRSRQARVERLLDASRRLADETTDEGRDLRRRLLETTGLSAASIELGVRRCLETSATPQELEGLLACAPPAPAAHVLLSGNVFVAALRAIALGVAASDRVRVRASRRDPALAEALNALAPELFEVTSELRPVGGDRLWVYGSDQTVATVSRQLPRGVWVHPHGHGLGAVVIEARLHAPLEPIAERVALDAVLFDQRGCLSPRVVCVQGDTSHAREVAHALARQLAQMERELPLGPRSAEELAEARRAHDAAAYAFELVDAGSGWVSLADQIVVPPSTRSLHVAPVSDAVQALAPLGWHLTCIGVEGSAELRARLRQAFPGARLAPPGEMQRPPLDGPVDRRIAPTLSGAST